MTNIPRRAFTLTIKLSADSRDDLARALEQFASDVARNEVSVGTYGSPSHGAIYELLSDPAQTHEKYFADLHAYLEAERNLATPAPPEGKK